MAQPSDYKIIPVETELDAIERDLRFHPVTNEQPTTLSRQQVEQFNHKGYLTGIRIFDKQQSDENRGYFDALLQRVTADGGDSYSISTAHQKHGRAYDLLTHPAIVARVCDLLGENVVAWGSHFFCKMPGDGKTVAWHQDASYWPLTPSKTVTVWLAIDDADRENGCMRVIPGSHREGHLAFRKSEERENNVLDQTVDDAERFGSPVDIELAAGEISMHADLLLHGSNANTSTRRRCGLTLRYCTADVRAHLGWNAKGVIVSGADESGHWANSARPTAE